MSMSGDCLRTVTPWAMTSCGSCAWACETRFCTSTAARSGIALEREGDREVRAAVVAAHGVDVQHVGHAVDLLVERHGHRFLDYVRARAEIVRGDLHRGQRDRRELCDRQPQQRQRADQQQEQRDDDREDRAVDEEASHRPRPSAAGRRSGGCGRSGRLLKLGRGDDRRLERRARARLLQAFDDDTIANRETLRRRPTCCRRGARASPGAPPPRRRRRPP